MSPTVPFTGPHKFGALVEPIQAIGIAPNLLYVYPGFIFFSMDHRRYPGSSLAGKNLAFLLFSIQLLQELPISVALAAQAILGI